MKYKFLFLKITFLLFSISVIAQSDILNGLEFEMKSISVPVFPKLTVNVAEFGAVGDGTTLNTQAFAKAINSVSEKGGGTVVIPKGIWLTGPIVLKSNINLHTEAGALIIFSRNMDDYPLV